MKFTEKIYSGLPTKINHTTAAELAQAAFDKWLSEQQVVYAFHDAPYGKHRWALMNDFPNKNPTHQARVVCIEELAPKKCEHSNVFFSSANQVYKCDDCNKTLKPNWSTE